MCWKTNNWILLTCILCIYGLFKEFRPVEPFLTPYLLAKNFTEEELDSQVYPVWTYSYLVALVPVFILTDLVRYKWVIIFESLCYLTTWILLSWGTSVLTMQFMQGAYGFATATEIAYYSYIYAVIDREHYQTATSYVRAAVVTGRTVGAAVSQLVVYLQPGEHGYNILNYTSLASMAFIFFVALALPTVGWHMSDITGNDPETTKPGADAENGFSLEPHEQNVTYGDYTVAYFRMLIRNFLKAYSSLHIVKWSVWWAFATCGFLQIGNYIQNLWSVIQTEKQLYNGLTELVNNIVSTCLVLGFQFMKIEWEIFGEITLGVITCIDAVLLLFMARTDNIWLAYVFYVIYSSLYQLMITIATYNLAKKLQTQSYGLVIGCNMFIALVLQTILTTVVADEIGLALPIREQFLVYGGYHLVISVVFLGMGGYTIGYVWNRHRRIHITRKDTRDDADGVLMQ